MGSQIEAFRQQGRVEGIAEGVVRNTLSSIRSLMETMNLTTVQAMRALKVPEQERSRYIELLQQNEGGQNP